MDWVKGGTLSAILKNRLNNHCPLSEEEVIKIIRGIILAVKYLHERDIMHRDIKLENVMLDNENDLSSIKLIDFGLSQLFQQASESQIKHSAGTPIYLPPESLNQQLHSKPVDIWSCGIMLFILCHKGRHPYYVKNDSILEISNKIKAQKFAFSSSVSGLAKDLILKML